MSIISIHCLKFLINLINLIIDYTITNVSFYILAFAYNMCVGFLFIFVFLLGSEFY